MAGHIPLVCHMMVWAGELSSPTYPLPPVAGGRTGPQVRREGELSMFPLYMQHLGEWPGPLLGNSVELALKA